MPSEAHLTLNGWNIPFVKHAKRLRVNFDRRITWRKHLEKTKAKAFRTFIRTHSLMKSECLSVNIKLTPYKHLLDQY
jgi:hypothetical protein